MIVIGRTNELRVSDLSPHGPFLTDGVTRILLPSRLAPPKAAPGDVLKVFVTTDSEDRPMATTQRPHGEVGEFVALIVKDITPIGAFMDWGLDKDLLIPFGEQQAPLRVGQKVLTYIGFDEKSNRVYGSTKIRRYLQKVLEDARVGDAVDGIVSSAGRDGARVVINGKVLGAIFPDELHRPISVGERRQMWIKRIREDGEIALSLSPSGYGAAQELGPQILERVQREGGFLPLSDHASPEDIRRAFGVSKSTYKKAIGTLQKQGEITIEFHGIRIVKKT